MSNRDPKYARWDTICGNVAAQLILLSFSGHRSSHLRHHAHTNTDRDPDLAAKGPLVALPIKWLASNVILVLVALPGGVQLASALKRRLGGEQPPTATTAVCLPSRAGRPVWGCWRADLDPASAPSFRWWSCGSSRRDSPSCICCSSSCGCRTSRIEHTDRFRNTRITLFPGSTWLLLQQDRHLIHHLYPSIPWYRYRAAHRELASLLTRARRGGGGTLERSAGTGQAPLSCRFTTGVERPQRPCYVVLHYRHKNVLAKPALVCIVRARSNSHVISLA